MSMQDAAKTPTTTTNPPAADGSLGSIVNKQIDSVERISNLALNWIFDKGPSVVASLALLIIAWIAAGWARRLVLKALNRAHLDLTLSKFLGNLTKWAIIVFAVVTSMGTLGLNTTTVATVVGAAGLAIGLALQGNLGNLASGVLLLVFRPFKIGDNVIVAGQTGVIDGIDLFTTNLDTADNRRIIVPNGAIFGGVIENQSRHPVRRVDLNIPIAATAEYSKVKTALEGAVAKVVADEPGVEKAQPTSVVMSEITPVTWSINLWAKTPNYGAVRQRLLREVKLAIETNKIGPPGASIDVRITSMPDMGP